MAAGRSKSATMPRDALLNKNTYNFCQIVNMANVSNGFFRICWPIGEQKSVIGSILRLNAWYHMKAEKISNQNIQDQLW